MKQKFILTKVPRIDKFRDAPLRHPTALYGAGGCVLPYGATYIRTCIRTCSTYVSVRTYFRTYALVCVSMRVLISR